MIPWLPLPELITTGSGNQGLTVSMPVIEYAEHLGAGKEKLYRALAISNLIAIHQKRYIGNLSAFCGAVTSACGAGRGGGYPLFRRLWPGRSSFPQRADPEGRPAGGAAAGFRQLIDLHPVQTAAA